MPRGRVAQFRGKTQAYARHMPSISRNLPGIWDAWHMLGIFPVCGASSTHFSTALDGTVLCQGRFCEWLCSCIGTTPYCISPPTPDGGTCTIWHCGGGKQPSICLAYANACGSHTRAGRPGPPVRGGGRYVLGSGPNTTPQSFTEKPLAQGRAVQGGREVRQ